MSHISVCRCNGSVAPPVSFIQAPLKRIIQLRQSTVTTSASKFGGFSLNSVCSLPHTSIWFNYQQIILCLLA